MKHGRAPSRRFIAVVPWLVLALAFVIALWRATGSASTPDEVQFLADVIGWQNEGTSAVPPNQLGYGSSWWIVLGTFAGLFNASVLINQDVYLSTESTGALQALAASRIFSTTLVFAALGYAMWKVPTKTARFAILSFLLLPIVWFSGKWSAPDLVALGLLIPAGSLLVRCKGFLAAVLMGAAIGIKLTNVFALVGFLLIAAWLCRERGWLKGLAAFCCLVLFGYLLANPFALLHPLQAIDFSKGIDSEIVPSWASARIAGSDLVFKGTVEWDSATRGNLLYWMGSPLVIIGLLGLQIALRRWALLAATMAGTICLTAVVAYRAVGYGWYYFPLIGMAFIATASQLPALGLQTKATRVLLSILVIGLFASTPKSYTELAYVLERSQAINETSTQMACIERNLPEGLPVANLIDPTVIPASLLNARDARPSYFAMRRFIEHDFEPETLTFITTQAAADKLSWWIEPLMVQAQEKAQCGRYIIGRPSST